MKKRLTKLTKILFLISIIFNYFGFQEIVKAYSNGDLSDTNKNITLITNNHTNMQDGDAKLTKSITEIDKSQGIYRVNISTQGKNITTTHSEAAKLYIGIAFDTSDSMEQGTNKLRNAKLGVQSFVSGISNNYQNAEFALVTYSGKKIFSSGDGAKIKTDFKRDISSEIDDLKREGGCTKLGEGIDETRKLIANKMATDPNAKYVMLVFGDGKPTCPSSVSYSNAANRAKSAGIEIFSIGYEVDSSGESVLKSIASDSKDVHYKSANTDGIVTTLSGLTSNVSVTAPASSNTTITDIIGDDFIYAGTKSGDDVIVDGQNVSINVGTVTEASKSYWFDIKINPDASGFKNNSWHDTNRGISLTGTGTGGTLTSNDSASVYWNKKLDYRIEYYYDNQIDPSKTVTGEGDLNDTVSVTDDMINANKGDFEYIGTDPSSKTINLTESDNVIKVYYESYKKLSITKKLENTTNNKKAFNIKLTLKNSNNELLNGTYKYKFNNEVKTLTFTNGVANITLKGNEKVEFINIPKNSKYEIEETTTDGYIVKTCLSDSCNDNNVISGTLDNNKDIKIINTANYEMPETGSSGMLILIIIGSLFIGIPVIYIIHNLYKKRYE